MGNRTISAASSMPKDTMQNTETANALKVLAGAFTISFSAVFVKAAHIGPTAAGFYRVFIGGILLFIILLCQKKKIFKGGKDLWFGLSAGIFFSIDLFTWHIAIHYVGPGLATIISNFQVFFMAFLGWLLYGEVITLKIAVAIPMAITGLFMMVGVNWNALGPQYHMGVFWAIITAITYAVFMISIKKQQNLPEPLSPYAGLFMVCFITATVLGTWAVLKGESLAITDMKTLGLMTAYGCLSQVLGWVLITKGLTHLRPSLAGLLLLIQPSLSFVWDMLFFNRPTTTLDIIGAVITITAIYLGTQGKKPGRKARA